MAEQPKIEKPLTWEDYTWIAAICIAAVFVLLLLGGAVKSLIRRKKKHEKAV